MPEQLLPDDLQSWTRKNLRTHLYHTSWERFMFKLMHDSASDDELLAAVPPAPSFEKSTLHCDAGPAFISLSKCALVLRVQLTHATDSDAGTSTLTGPHAPNTRRPM
jgi:hypothetical protein